MNKIAIIALASAVSATEKTNSYDGDAFYGDGNGGKRGPRETLDAYWHIAHNAASPEDFDKAAALQGAFVPSSNKGDKVPSYHNNGGYVQQYRQNALQQRLNQQMAYEYNDDVKDSQAGLAQGQGEDQEEDKPKPAKKAKKDKKSKSKGKKKGSKSKGKGKKAKKDKKSKSKGKKDGKKEGPKKVAAKAAPKPKPVVEEEYKGPNGIPVKESDKIFKLWTNGNGAGSEKQDVFWDMGQKAKTAEEFDKFARQPDLRSMNKKDKAPKMNQSGFYAQMAHHHHSKFSI